MENVDKVEMTRRIRRELEVRAYSTVDLVWMLGQKELCRAIILEMSERREVSGYFDGDGFFVWNLQEMA